MSTATLTDLTGATDPSVPFGNDVNLVDQQLTNLEAANIAHPNSAVQISTTMRWFELGRLKNYASFNASTAALEDYATSNLLTWKQQTAELTITEMQVSSDKVLVLDSNNFWVVKLQTATSRTGSWTTHATITFNASSSEYEKFASGFSVSVPVNRFARVSVEWGNTGAGFEPKANLTITLIGKYAQVT